MLYYLLSRMKKVTLMMICLSALASFQAWANQTQAIAPILMLLLSDDAPETDLQPLAHRSVLNGPLSGAHIEAHWLSQRDNTNPFESTTAQKTRTQYAASGTFNLSLTDAMDDEWFLVSASNGEDIDHDADSIPDRRPTEFGGTLHALAPASAWRDDNLVISPFTELVWRYAENIIPLISLDELHIRLDEIALALFDTDLNGDGTINYTDVLSFDPFNQDHISHLAIDFAWFNLQNEDNVSIISALLEGDIDAQLQRTQQLFNYLLLFNPVPDSRYQSITVGLSVFGMGSASSEASIGLNVNSMGPQPSYRDVGYFIKNNNANIILTAVAANDSNVLGWKGCDNVSRDLTQCTIAQNQNRDILIMFGQKDTQLKGTFYDLTRLNVTVTDNNLEFTVPTNNDAMINQLAGAVVGDFVAGDEGDGYLRRIVAINRFGNNRYELATVNAELDEVISSGTMRLATTLTNGNLISQGQIGSGISAFIPAPGIKNVQLLKSEDDDDKTFTMVFGNSTPSAKNTFDEGEGTAGISRTVVLYRATPENSQLCAIISSSTCGEVTATGELKFNVDIDVAADYGLIDGLRFFEFAATVKSQQRLALNFTAPIASVQPDPVHLGTIPFRRIAFAIGPVPVWVTPRVDIFAFFDGSINAQSTFEVSFNESFVGGIRYSAGAAELGQDAWVRIAKGTFNVDHKLAETAVQADLSSGLRAAVGLKLYDITGPKIIGNGGAKLASSVPIDLSADCFDGVGVTFSSFIDIGFNWDFSGETKVGRLLRLDQLENSTRFTIYNNEWKHRMWNFLGNCPEPDHSILSVQGQGVITTIEEGDTAPIVATFEVSNNGKSELNWELVTEGLPLYVLASNTGGTIPVGNDETTVTVTVDPVGLLEGEKRIELLFRNVDRGSPQPLEPSALGDTTKIIEITVLPKVENPNPPFLEGNISEGGIVNLQWLHFPRPSEPAYIGFKVAYTTTPDDPSSWQIVQMHDIHTLATTVHNIPIDQRGYVAVYAYNLSTDGPFSNAIEVIPSVLPPADIEFGNYRAASVTITDLLGDLDSEGVNNWDNQGFLTSFNTEVSGQTPSSQSLIFSYAQNRLVSSLFQSSLTTPATNLNITTNYSYHPDGRAKSVTTNSSTTQGELVFNYDSSENVVGATNSQSTSIQVGNSVLNSSTNTDYALTYDVNNRIQDVNFTKTNTGFQGNISTEQGSHHFEYDNSNNLIRAVRFEPSGEVVEYDYLPFNGNTRTHILKQTSSTGQILLHQQADVTYEDGLCKREKPSDINVLSAIITAPQAYSPDGLCILQ